MDELSDAEGEEAGAGAEAGGGTGGRLNFFSVVRLASVVERARASVYTRVSARVVV